MSLEAIRARTAARKAAGAIPVYAHPPAVPQSAAGEAVRRSLPCVHEGPIQEWCPSCPATAEGRHVRECDLHERCTREPVSGKVRACATCADRTTDERVGALQRIAHDPPAYPGGSGECLMTVGGGKYWPGVVVLVRMLRDTGSTLPVQVWYRGSVEPVRSEQVAGLGVELVDVEQFAEWRNRPALEPAGLKGNPSTDKDGWRVKLFALAHTRYETVFYLDSDAYLLVDPAPFLARARRDGFACWSDPWDIPLAWGAVWPRGTGTRSIPIQGGQLAIHRPSVWREICLAREMNRDADYYYRHLHGDQDTWRVAFAIAGRPFGHLGAAAWESPAFVCGYEGRPVLVHRCRCKMFAPEYCADGEPNNHHGERCPHLPQEDRAYGYFEELR